MTKRGGVTVNATNITTDGEFVLDNDSCQLEEALDHRSSQETVYSQASISTSEQRSLVTRRDRFHACASPTNAFVHVVLGIVYRTKRSALKFGIGTTKIERCWFRENNGETVRGCSLLCLTKRVNVFRSIRVTFFLLLCKLFSWILFESNILHNWKMIFEAK